MTKGRGIDGEIAVAIIEDHVMVCEALHTALEMRPGIRVVGAVNNLQDGTVLVEHERPDVVVLDHCLPDGDAVDAVEAIRKACDETAILVLSAISDYHSVLRTLEVGANGYLLKHQTMDELDQAIRLVHRGGRPLAPQLVSALVTRLTGPTTSAHRLGRREIEVLRLLAEGLSTEELSARLHLSVNTVRNYVQKAIRRLGAHSKLEAVAIAQREGIIPSAGASE